MMIIGIDASRATKSFQRGSDQYSFYLIKNLARLDFQNEYWLYSPYPPHPELTRLPQNFHWKILPFFRFWTHIRLSSEMLCHPPNLLFVPSHVLPWIHPQKTVVTIHDLAYRYFPSAYPALNRFYEYLALKLAQGASKIIVPSQATKNDLLKWTKINPEKIVVIHHGVDYAIYQSPQEKKVNYPYLLFLGKLEERKNLKRIIEAFAMLKKEKKLPHKLVLVGQPGFRYQEIDAKIQTLPQSIQKEIIPTGYLPTHEVIRWLKNADILLFPTLYEGFGLPVLEAMAAGVPVLASQIPALKEIASDAAFFVDPQKPKEIATGIERLLSDQDVRKQLIQKGQERAKSFSWQKCAQETLNVLQAVFQEKGG